MTTTTNPQGLGPIRARLVAEGIDHHVAQVGGGCLAVHVPFGEGRYLAIVSAAYVMGEEGWNVSAYGPDDAIHEGVTLTADQAVLAIRDIVADGLPARAVLDDQPQRD